MRATMSSLPALLNSQPPKPFSLLPISKNSLSSAHFLSLKPSPIHLSLRYDAVSAVHDGAAAAEEEHIIGDCLVFEEGVFEDPYLNDPPPSPYNPTRKSKLVISVEPEDLVPEKWKEAQAEINVTKKERRRMKVAAEFGTKLERRRQGLIPAGMSADEFRTVKLAELKPVVLDRPNFVVEERVEKDRDSGRGGDSDGDGDGSSGVQGSGRVEPRNPRLAVYGAGLDDVLEFLNSERYDPEAAKKPEGSRNRLFTKEEKDLMNKRVPDLAAATSDKWHPLHTVAAAGEFYLVDALLKHNVDINVPDKDGLTALHKAVLGKKQAIFNYLLRESANPFIRDKEGATLMHYAVRTASSPMIKILLLYNVDINLQDNDGWTPLHLAVQSRRTDIVRLLLIKGADKTLKNKDGLTPFDLCLYSGRDARTYELIRLMKQLLKPRRHVLQQNQLTS